MAGAGACAVAALVTAPRRELVLGDFFISGSTTWVWKGQWCADHVLLSAVVSACLQGAKSSLPCDLKERCMLSPRTIIQRVETRGWSYALPGVSNK